MSEGEITVRPALAEEAEEVARSYEWLFAPPGAPVEGWDLAVAADRIRATIAGEGSTMLVAVADGRIVGICSAYIDLLSVRYGLRCWVEDLAVDPAVRSRGAGAALLGAAREFAVSRGASHLELDSGDARTDAHRFYDREGANVHSRCFGWHGLAKDAPA
jgi:GNAT superfamily N-acetyltransferase